MLKTNQCGVCIHQPVCRIFYQIKDIFEAEITLSNCIRFSKVKTNSHIGNDVDVPTIQRKNRSLQDILKTTDSINNISKSTESINELIQNNCSFCNNTVDELVECSECGKKCCTLCATETGDINNENNQEKKYVCPDCW